MSFDRLPELQYVARVLGVLEEKQASEHGDCLPIYRGYWEDEAIARDASVAEGRILREDIGKDVEISRVSVVESDNAGQEPDEGRTGVGFHRYGGHDAECGTTALELCRR